MLIGREMMYTLAIKLICHVRLIWKINLKKFWKVKISMKMILKYGLVNFNQ